MTMEGSASRALAVGLALIATLAFASGCATKGFVQSEVAGSKAYTDSQLDQRMGDMQGNVDKAQSRADAAFDKATLAERLANGSVQYTEVSTHTVQFAFDDYRLSTEAQGVLDDLGSKLGSHPSYVLEVRGFTDATGSNRYNLKLGHERAESVERYMLTHYDVPMARIAIVSFGEEQPVANNDTRSGREANRRVQVRLLDLQREQGEPVASRNP